MIIHRSWKRKSFFSLKVKTFTLYYNIIKKKERKEMFSFRSLVYILIIYLRYTNLPMINPFAVFLISSISGELTFTVTIISPIPLGFAPTVSVEPSARVGIVPFSQASRLDNILLSTEIFQVISLNSVSSLF